MILSGVNKTLPKVVHHKIRPDTSIMALTDTSKINIDSVTTATQPILKSYHSVVDSLLLAGKFINVKEPATYFITEKKTNIRRRIYFLFIVHCGFNSGII